MLESAKIDLLLLTLTIWVKVARSFATKYCQPALLFFIRSAYSELVLVRIKYYPDQVYLDISSLYNRCTRVQYTCWSEYATARTNRQVLPPILLIRLIGRTFLHTVDQLRWQHSGSTAASCAGGGGSIPGDAGDFFDRDLSASFRDLS